MPEPYLPLFLHSVDEDPRNPQAAEIIKGRKVATETQRVINGNGAKGLKLSQQGGKLLSRQRMPCRAKKCRSGTIVKGFDIHDVSFKTVG